MSTTAAAVYRALLHKVPALPATLLRAAVRTAGNESGTTLARLLAQRADLPADTADTLTRIDKRKVPAHRAAVTQALAIGDAGVATPGAARAFELARAVNASSPSGWAIQNAINSFQVRPSHTLLRGLLKKPVDWYTSDESAMFLRYLCREPDLAPSYPFDTLHGLARRAGNDNVAELLGELGNVRSNAVIARALLRTPVATSAALQYLIQSGNRVFGGRYSYSAWAAELAAAVCHTTLKRGNAILSGLPPLFQCAPTMRDEVIRLFGRNEDSTGVYKWDTRPVCRPRPEMSLADATITTLIAHASQPNPDTVSAALNVVLERAVANELFLIGPALLTNSATRPEDVTRYAKELLANTEWTNLRDTIEDQAEGVSLSRVDAIDLHGDDQLVVKAWCALFPDIVIRRHGWHLFDQTTTELWRGWMHTTNGVYPKVIQAANERPMTDAMILDTPVQALLLLVTADNGAPTAQRLSRILAEHIVDDSTAQVFDRVAEAYDGTLRELLDLVAELAK